MVIPIIPRGSYASLSLLLCLVQVATGRDTAYISGTSIYGITKQLAVDRTPALYTGNFGDCQGGQSLFNVTKFDAAYYKDNATVLFHLDGISNIENESLMMRFSMDAYGENRFQKIFDPCSVNIHSLCPLNASVPVEAWAVFPVGPEQVGDIPDLSFTIPDLEGTVRLQIFANSSRGQIGCFQASVTNGVTMSQPRAIGPVLAIFTAVAIASSFAIAACDMSITQKRTHYAHSLSAMTVFETFQSIFFSGALSLCFPSILTAWWSNFAWSAAQIFSRSMVTSMNSFNGVIGETSQAGSAGPVVWGMQEGNLAQQIYGRSQHLDGPITDSLLRPQPFNASDPYDYTWSGHAVGPGIPLPGTWTGFQSTLAAVGVPASDALTTSLVWLSVLFGILVLGMTFLKLSLEFLVITKRIRDNNLLCFRSNWIKYTTVACLRTLFVAFSIVVTLSFYQLSIRGSKGAKALAAMSLLLFLLGLGGLAAYVCHLRLRLVRFTVRQDRIIVFRKSWLGPAPLICFVRSSNLTEADLPGTRIGSVPFIRIICQENDVGRTTVYQDRDFVTEFGWLSARYRRRRWWFFGCTLIYQLVRAVFIGGAVASPQTQVYGLLILEVIALSVFAKLRPFEGRRNMALAIWMQGTSKVLTTGLSVAFLPTVRASRILTTAIGLVIVVIQGLLVLGLMILVAIGAVSSYISLTRNAVVRPTALRSMRLRYLEHLDTASSKVHLSKEQGAWQDKIREAEKCLAPVQPSFSVIAVRRVSKIEDEDEEEGILGDLASNANQANRPMRLSRSNSVSSRMSTHSLPRAARAHRVSWSSQDFREREALSLQRADSGLARRLSGRGLPPSNVLSVIPPHVVEEEPARRDSEDNCRQPGYRGTDHQHRQRLSTRSRPVPQNYK